MSNQASLFPLMEREAASKMPKSWLLATNHLNLLYMLAAGMIMSPKGFGQKYFTDPLGVYPGWIPLFADRVPASAIDQALSEAKHLKPCLLNINLSGIKGRIKSIGADNTVRDLCFPDEFVGTEKVLLLPAPLPVTFIESIIFRSKKEKIETSKDAQEYNNVPFSNFTSELKKRLFSGKYEVSWPGYDVVIKNRDLAMDAPFAAGAMLAMMFKMAVDPATEEASKLAFNPESGISHNPTDPIIASIGEWQRHGQTPAGTTDLLKKLFWGIVDALIANHSSLKRQSDFEVVLTYLKTAAGQFEERLKEPLLKLSDDLKKLASFGESTITELFERHPKSFSRVMTLFFLRGSCPDLLEFKHPLLQEKDYLLAAILFAARDGWLNLPMTLRNTPGLMEAVSHRMAAMAHRMANDDLDLGTPPARPKSLSELFTEGVNGWSKNQNEAAVFLARDCQWSCIRTKITLGKGTYKMEVDGRGTHIFLDGEAKAVQCEVDKEIFGANLRTRHLTHRQDQHARTLLKA